MVANATLAPPGPIALPGTPWAYGITVASTSPVSAAGRLARIDLVSGAVRQGRRLPAASELFVAGGAVDTLVPAGETARGAPVWPWALWRLRPPGTVLERVGVLHLASGQVPVVPTGGLVAGTTDTWVGAGTSVVEIDSATGAVRRRLRLADQVTSVAVSPGGRHLYVAVDRTGSDPLADPAAVVSERDASTGRLIATRGYRFSVDGADLVAVGGGLWVSYRTGMAGNAELYAAAGLRPLATATGRLAPVWRILSQGGEVIQGPSVTVSGDHAWLTSPVGLACVDPDTGRFRGGARYPLRDGTPPGWQPLAQDHARLYLTRPVPANGSTDILRVRPPSGCAAPRHPGGSG